MATVHLKLLILSNVMTITQFQMMDVTQPAKLNLATHAIILLTLLVAEILFVVMVSKPD